MALPDIKFGERWRQDSVGVLVCVSLAASDTAQALALMGRAARLGADLAEVRLDLMESFDLETLVRQRPLPLLVTCRPLRSGGGYVGLEAERTEVLRLALELGAEYVDAEPEDVPLLRECGSGKVIASWHDYQGTPFSLEQRYAALAHTGADVVKVAVTARTIEDNLEVLRLLERAEKPCIALAMGEAGVISRLLAGRYGALLTFASLGGHDPVAPGQVDLREMLEWYRVKDIGPDTALYGVIANPVGHSMSPAVHNAAFRELGLNAVYLPLLVEDPVRFIRAFTPLGFRGYSVTIPHKQVVIPVLDQVEPLARRIGAVNTIVIRDGRLHGYNTDVEGALQSIEEVLPAGQALSGLRALVVGAGGLGRGLAYALADRGVKLTIANRSEEKGRLLAAELGAAFCPLGGMAGVEVDLLLQTTSVGMRPAEKESVVPADMLRPGMVVYDAVYNPLETRLLREARRAGCTIVSGLGHFINQAARQFELWTGLPAPREVMRAVMLERLGGKG